MSAQCYGPIAAEGAAFLGTFSRAELATILKFIEGALDLQQRHIERLEREG
jgi:hypothetical protein